MSDVFRTISLLQPAHLTIHHALAATLHKPLLYHLHRHPPHEAYLTYLLPENGCDLVIIGEGEFSVVHRTVNATQTPVLAEDAAYSQVRFTLNLETRAGSTSMQFFGGEACTLSDVSVGFLSQDPGNPVPRLGIPSAGTFQDQE